MVHTQRFLPSFSSYFDRGPESIAHKQVLLINSGLLRPNLVSELDMSIQFWESHKDGVLEVLDRHYSWFNWIYTNPKPPPPFPPPGSLFCHGVHLKHDVRLNMFPFFSTV
ncbi:hypothetical protein GDO81_011573 [Engystomops pustulosus]|uniref:Uncharacterized protein n=1 Tax=Engystomops pustulosus TaxID=76066 RepID=A0AAV7BF94_ENGPU|nr:hypothetical protein GDO81_011573 [Engystomops pustulosus]